MRGVIKSYNKKRGYGFVESNNKDYFFRWTDIVTDSHKHCEKGERVSFIPELHDRGLRAIQVQAI